jgi:catechol 2,3-dioxygenase-like lactoylglutathione lyase family enzyme
MDLGYYVLCLESGDVDGSTAFYESLGFKSTGFNVPGDSRTVVQGRNQLAFFDFYEYRNVNFRGPDIPKLATELALQGFKIETNMVWDETRQEFRHQVADKDKAKAQLLVQQFPDAAECGAFVVFDPDGFDLFFNTNPGERGPYERSQSNPIFSDEEGWPPDFSADRVPVSLPLGELVICLDVRDAAQTIEFYTKLGLSMAEQTHRLTRLSYELNGVKMGPDYVIREAAQKDLRFGFMCQDQEAAAHRFQSLGIDIDTVADGFMFSDCDGKRIELLNSGST